MTPASAVATRPSSHTPVGRTVGVASTLGAPGRAPGTSTRNLFRRRAESECNRRRPPSPAPYRTHRGPRRLGAGAVTHFVTAPWTDASYEHRNPWLEPCTRAGEVAQKRST
jgi:hypothetical protein